MNNLEKEFIYLSELTSYNGKEYALQEIKDASGLVNFEEENGNLIYTGNDGTLYSFNLAPLFDVLVTNKLVEPIESPDDFNVPLMKECVSLSKIRIREYLQKLRNDITSGVISP